MIVKELEDKNEEIKAMLQESHAELLSERDVNNWLRDLIAKIEKQVRCLYVHNASNFM